ncbi:MAG: Bacterial aa3 type cytochrome c oxidase subunit [Pseudomonadota bacterium]|jgi:Bacterial aa3 type cytochrome c oxidase subunit IV
MAGDQDMKAHSETYLGVMSLMKWGSVATALVVIFVIMMIAG